jgi:tripartite-type tricarboxylate transporter receptor subunit TctC
MTSFKRFVSFVLPLVPLVAFAQVASYPDRSIHLVVPAAPGGGQDMISRMVAEQMSKDWGQPVVVENKVGASGIIGSDLVAKAKPDGYTIMIQSFQHATNPSLHKSLPYDTLKDFTAISTVASQGLVVTFNPKIPADSIKDFIKLAKANPGKYNYASGGLGSSQHLFAELFVRTAGIDVVHVPYAGIAPGMISVVTGDTAFMFNQVSTSLPNIPAGKLKALAFTGKERSPLLPDVPSLDSSLPGFEARTWFAMFGPAGMPKALVDKISAEVAHIVRLPAIREKLDALGVDGIGNTPEQAQAFNAAEAATWAKHIRAWGINAE